LSISITLGFFIIWLGLKFGNQFLLDQLGRRGLLWASIGIFVMAWIGQFIGHKIEGAKPSFIEDLQYLMIGPAWLLHFIYKKIGIPY
jgi:uncharacterized membrane protein YGL010W